MTDAERRAFRAFGESLLNQERYWRQRRARELGVNWARRRERRQRPARQRLTALLGHRAPAKEA